MRSGVLVVCLWCLDLPAGCDRRAPDLQAAYEAALLGRQSGAFSAALDKTRAGMATAQRHGLDEWLWKFRLLEAEIGIPNGVAVDLDVLTNGFPQRFAGSLLGARRDKVLGQLAWHRRQDSLADQHFAASLALQRRFAPTGLTAETLLFQARRLVESGEAERGAAVAREALAIARRLPDPYWQTSALNLLGTERIEQERYEQALPYLDEALAIATRIKAEDLVAVLSHNAAICASRLGDMEKGHRLLTQAAAIHEARDARWGLATSLSELGGLWLLEREPRRALPFLERGVALARKLARGGAAPKLEGLARVYAGLGEWRRAGTLAREAEREPLPEGAVDTRVRTQLVLARVEREAGAHSAAEARVLRALDLAGDLLNLRWELRSELAELYVQMGKPAAAEASFVRALADLDRAQMNLTEVDHRVAFLAPVIHTHRVYVRWLIGQGRIADALAVAEASRSRVLWDTLGHARPAGGQLLPLLKNKARARDAVLISFWVTPDESFAWLVSGTDLELFRLPGQRRIEQLVKDHRELLDKSVRDPRRLGESPATALYRQLFAPMSRQLAGARRVVIAADGPLHAVPFASLVVPRPLPHFWLEDATITVAPSLTLSGDAAQPVPDAAPILAVGDPLPQAPDFPRLPNAALEIDDLVRRFGKQTTVLRGQEATPEAYRALDLAQYSMIHFAAHAVASEVSPLDSNIILSPGSRGARLSVRDVRLQSLTASLVTVSSCRGAGVRAYFGEGLIGFAWGFLGAGARQVIAGQWDVPDASTAELMKALYAALAEGLEPAAALRQAQQQIVSQPEPPAPYYWAGFQVYEGPGARAAASPPATTRLTKAL